ncbi:MULTISPECIES: 2-oxo acid dehydrogenase subunit E2 [Acidiplasma]|uniref:2-oxoacid dehydrogenase acyltransferase catalytic domain-containing protein n=2 Tax=Acidiplasma TaxID=507753 RepID=A0A0Q0XHU7_9ARCH|nr:MULTISPECIES: 2-oxo acid dehydrogenase subunit E2 [Acidiplasma]KPV46030.1 hypothetical protein SE19_07310 [Acidiplasma aeolicum]KQB34202.1 hypothetical protein AOG55_01280 [Acidiplasma cupricumulans]KQB35746.1 hypothetical protein AOG54_02755 [Acidiplasma aeolicum]
MDSNLNDIKRLADQYNINLDSLNVDKNLLTMDYIKKYIAENFYPHVIERKPITGIRKMIADHLVSGLKESAIISLYSEILMDDFMAAYKSAGVSMNVLLIKIISNTLMHYPYMNSEIKNNEIITYDSHNIGIAVDSKIGLIVPVIRNVNTKDIKTLDNEYRELIARAKNGIIKEIDITGGTFTISNLGSLGVSYFMSIPNWPQVAILSIGRTEDKPVVLDGKIEIRKIMTASITVDHRAVDGAPAARFLSELKYNIENFRP